MVEAPGVVTGRYGTIGEVFYLGVNFWPLNTTLWVSHFHGNDARFVYYMLQCIDFTTHSGKSGVPGVNRNDLHAEDVFYPRELSEQRAIADALGDADSLIASLERLIAKKRDIKQGMMQELLTGRTRLPGFDAAWQTVAFGEIASLSRDRVSPGASTGRVIELEHLASGTGVLLGDANVADSASLKTKFAAGDVLFGKLRAYLRKFWLADRDGHASTEIWAIRARPGVALGAFLRYVVEQDSFIESASTAYGTHMPRSDWKVVSRYELLVPPLNEQQAISGVLRAADAEIAALDRRLESTRAIKQGMMQELLSGRTRLLVKECAA